MINPLIIQLWNQWYEQTAWKRKTVMIPWCSRLILELACGAGEYTQTLSTIYPWFGFVGIDRKGERLWKWATSCYAEGKTNCYFLRTLIHHLDRHFITHEVDEIWIIHPDPRPKWADERRRLTSWRFVPIYDKILHPWGIIRLKTDDADLFIYSLASMSSHWYILQDSTTDLYASTLLVDHHGIQTHYESKFILQWHKIHYAIWKKPG